MPESTKKLQTTKIWNENAKRYLKDGKRKVARKVGNEFIDFAIEYPQSALSLITGLVVSLIEHSVRSQGEDETLELKIEGLQKRNITIHKVE